MNISLVSFMKNDNFSQTASNISLWLIGAKVGETIVKMVEPKSFFNKIEKLHGFISMTDLSWVNNLCKVFLGRAYAQPKIESTKPTFIKVGVGANNVVGSEFNIEIKKMSSWPAENPTRIYVDALVNGKEFHYYICKNGKQGRFIKGKNEMGVPFSAMVPKEMEFLGLKTEKEVINWTGVKGFYKKAAA